MASEPATLDRKEIVTFPKQAGRQRNSNRIRGWRENFDATNSLFTEQEELRVLVRKHKVRRRGMEEPAD